jgi:metallophosphoesterase superfamily enzyme
MRQRILVLLALVLSVGNGSSAEARNRWLTNPVKAWKEARQKRAATAARPVIPAAREVVPLTETSIAFHFPRQSSQQIRTALQGGKWKPSAEWLGTSGKRYGRLLVMSDLHVGVGPNPLTQQLPPSEDFLAEHEADFARMVRREWVAARRDRNTRTLVFNGDTFEFMQTSKAQVGQSFTGQTDKFGPLNTPDNIAKKMSAILAGHARFFGTWAEHLARGHRIVVLPGNHDHQLLNPHVRGVLLDGLKAGVAKAYVESEKFKPEVQEPAARQRAAQAEAERTMAERFEFHPYLLIVGDLVVRHGHETDATNTFRTPFGEFYRPTGGQQPIEGAAGDYVVKSTFNRAEAKNPWADNTANTGQLVKTVLRSLRYNPFKILGVLRYILTREGTAKGQPRGAMDQALLKADLTRYVEQYGLLRSFNEIRPQGKQLSESQLVDLLFNYESAAARPLLARFREGDGFSRRVATLIAHLPDTIRQGKSKDIRQRLADYLHRELYARHSYGHDHEARISQRLALENGKPVTTYDSLDTETWLNGVEGDLTRHSAMGSAQRRGVLLVDFDKQGSHAELMRFDAARGVLLRQNLVESEAEAQESMSWWGRITNSIRSTVR